jgi:SAM-dependent methyltransferase
VLEVGGAPGTSGVPLCERGYAVPVVDPVPLHVEQANLIAHERHPARMSATLGDARDLATLGTEFDAVLLLGPLYHLTDPDDRALALTEAVRVTRPGGVIVAAGISRFASLLEGLRRRLLDDPTFRSIVERDLRDGQHRNPHADGRPEFFTTAYFHTPLDLESEARAAGLRDVRVLAVEGPAWILEDHDDLDNQLFAARATESEPSLAGVSAHLLVTGKTPADHRSVQ